MPQLKPSPWFLTILFVWVMFLLLAPSKILFHNFPSQLLLKNTYKFSIAHWNWLWQ